MLKKILAGLLAAVLTAAPGLAEVCVGTTVAAQSLSIFSEGSGTLEAVNVKEGARIVKGDVLAALRTTKVFAGQDGEIARIHPEEGDEIEGTVLELQPVSRYTIYCTVERAHESSEMRLVHSGERVYIRCTEDSSHRGTATITQIDENTYLAEATGGEFYVGEAVYLYRDDAFTPSQRVGIGTVVTCAAEAYEADGKIIRIHVEEGEYVQRGELLYEYISDGEAVIEAPASGIITSVEAASGDRIDDGQTLFTIVSPEDIIVEVQVEEDTAASLQVGGPAALSYAVDAEERLYPGEIVSISHTISDSLYTVRIRPENTPEFLGMTVAVRFG